MKKIDIHSNSPLRSLFHEAQKAQKNAYSPYFKHPVGAAIISDYLSYSGANVEVANGDGTCAEAGAIAEMVKSGKRNIEHIAIVGPTDKACPPCGRCRQRIREFSNDNTKVHVFANNGDLLKTYTMDELLPDFFGPENLQV